jgi:glycosyltransferase involved in cell wall biosynthesis
VAFPGGDRLGSIRTADDVSAKAHREGPLRLLFIGNLTPNKGLYPLIEALAAIPADRWHLTAVGSLSMDSSYVRAIRSHLHRLGLTQRVELTGVLTGDALRQKLLNSQVFVMPFSHESFGIVFLESMAFGLPVIGSSAGGAREIIDHGRNGFLVQPGDDTALRQQILHLERNRGRLEKMGLSALATFRRHPTWRDSMESIHLFLNALSARRRAKDEAFHP